MGAKVDAYRALLKAMAADHQLRPVGVALGNELQTKHRPAEMLAMADGIMHLDQLKKLVDKASEAVNEQVKTRRLELYEYMLANEVERFARKGKSFYQDTDTWVKAREDLGGRTNPDLRDWLERNELGNIVKQDINYQTLQGTINEWLKTNPVDAVVDGDFVHGDRLLEHLAITADELAERRAQRDRIHELCDIGESHTVGMRQA